VGEPAIESQGSVPADAPSWRDRVEHALAWRPPSLGSVVRETRAAHFAEWERKAARGEIDFRHVEGHAKALEGTTLPRLMLDAYSDSIAALLAVVATVAAFFVPLAWLDSPSGVADWAIVVVVWAVCEALVLGILVSLLTERALRALGEKGRIATYVAFALLCVGIVALLDRWDPSFGRLVYAVSAAAMTAPLIVITVACAVLFIIAFEYALQRLAIRRHPDSVFVRATLDAVIRFSLVVNGAQRDLYWRRDAVRQLETAAIAVERLPRFIRARDPATGAWMLDETAQIASALRLHKRAVLMPGAGNDATRARLNASLARLKQTARLASVGDWEHIERRPVPQVSRGSRLRTLIATTVVAVAPLAAVLLLREYAGILNGPLGGYTVAATAVWFIVSFLARYDPLFSTKIGAVKDLSGPFAGG
jgi:hypothetical protein